MRGRLGLGRLALLLALLAWATPAAAFTHYKTVTIRCNTNTQCGTANSANFSLAIALDGNVQAADVDFKQTGSGGCSQDANGYDIRPFTDTTFGTAIPYQLVYYDSAAGKFQMKVQIATLHFNADDTFVLACGDASLNTDGSSKADVINANIVNEYHFGGTSLSLSGSTTTAYNLTDGSTTGSVAGVTGQIFEGSRYVRAGLTSGNLLNTTGTPITGFPWTFKVWASLQNTSFSAGEQRILMSVSKTTGNEGCWISYQNFSSTVYLAIITSNANNQYTNLYTVPGGITTGKHLIVGVFTNATTLAMYYDGTVTTLGGGSPFGSTQTPAGLDVISLGAELETGAFSPWAPFYGDLDEAVGATAAWTASWIAATYYAEKATSNLLGWSALTAVSTGGSRLTVAHVGK